MHRGFQLVGLEWWDRRMPSSPVYLKDLRGAGRVSKVVEAFSEE